MNLQTAESQIESLPKDDRVRLRRGRRSAGFWRILADQDLDVHPTEEPRLELILRAVALLGQGSVDYGAALYEANYSQLRLERLLETKDLLDEARKTILFLDAKEQSADWTQLHNYLKYQNDRARRAIARSYFYRKYEDNQ